MKDLLDKSFNDEIPVRQARLTLSFKFHMGRQNINRILKEMSDMKLIQYTDCQTLLIIWKAEKVD